MITRIWYKSKNHILSELIHLQVEEYPVCHFSNLSLCILAWLKWFHNEAEKPFFTQGKCYWLIISYEDYIWIFIFSMKMNRLLQLQWITKNAPGWERHVSLWPVQRLSFSSAGFHAYPTKYESKILIHELQLFPLESNQFHPSSTEHIPPLV